MKNCIVIVALTIVSALASQASGQVNLVKIDGSSLSSGSVTVAMGEVTTDGGKLDINELRLIDFGKQVTPSSSGISISLLGGGVLRSSALRLDNEAFVLENVAGQIRLGVEAVTQIRYRNEELPLFSKASPKQDVDQLFVKIEGNYQTVPGIVESMDDSTVKFLYDEDVIEFKTEDVFGLILAQGAERRKAEVNGMVTLTEGSRLSCLIRSVTADEIQATVGGVADVLLPLNVVSRIEIRSNRLAFLSDLEPESVEFHKGAVFSRELKNDRNIAGGQLVLRDRSLRVSKTYAKGLGTKSGMSVAYANNGFDRMVAMLGMDASTNGNGICRVQVLGDGRKLFDEEVSGTDPPRLLDVEITNVNRIELVIDFGSDFLDLSDHLNWCDARFVKNNQ